MSGCEGTQLEPARVFVTDKGDRLMGYGETEEGEEDEQEMMYVDLTRQLASEWKRLELQPSSAHAELR